MKEILSPCLIECKCNDTWDAFIKESPDGNVYSISDYLESYNENISKLFLKEGNQILASVIVIITLKRRINPLAFSSFQGVCIRSIEGKKHSVKQKG